MSDEKSFGIPEAWFDDAKSVISAHQKDVSYSGQHEWFESMAVILARRILSMNSVGNDEEGGLSRLQIAILSRENKRLNSLVSAICGPDSEISAWVIRPAKEENGILIKPPGKHPYTVISDRYKDACAREARTTELLWLLSCSIMDQRIAYERGAK